MAENKQEKIENQKNETQKEEKTVNIEKTKKIKTRTILVLAAIAIFIFGSLILYRAEYLSIQEIGEKYIETFLQNIKYKMNIGIINFICIFTIASITNKLIKKGLKQFFEEEKKEMPKLPNKSISLIMAIVSSIIVSNLFLQKVILFVNATSFGITDLKYGMDMGFYMFQMPLIRTITLLCTNYSSYNDNIHSCILSNRI